MTTRKEPEVRTLAENRKARFDYAIEDTLMAGIMLEGWEVKAILAGQLTFNGASAFVRFHGGEAFLEAVTITPLPQALKGGFATLDPARSRKLLLKSNELRKLEQQIAQKGYTVVPLSLSYKRKIKVHLGLAKGKKLADKRETIKERDQARDVARELAAR